MNIFWGMNILWIFFWVHPKIGLVLGLFLCILGSFLKVNIQNRDIFWVAKISFFFFFLGGGGGCFKFLIFFGG